MDRIIDFVSNTCFDRAIPETMTDIQQLFIYVNIP